MAAHHLQPFNRDASGNLLNITSQDGQVTTVTLNAGDYLETVTPPELKTVQIACGTGGLISSFTDAKLNSSTFLYDGLGLLEKDTNAEGGFFQSARTKTRNLATVTVTTTEGRVSRNSRSPMAISAGSGSSSSSAKTGVGRKRNKNGEGPYGLPH